MKERIASAWSRTKWFNLICIAALAAYVVYACAATDTDQFANKAAQRLIVGIVIAAVVFSANLIIFIFDKKAVMSVGLFIKYRFAWCTVLLITFSVIGLHGFSAGMWSNYLASDTENATVIWGTNMAITSDVWAIGIPQLLNQVNTGFPLFNETMMTGGGNTVLGGLPALDPVIIGQPHYWGMFFGIDFGLAWLFWFRKFVIFLGAFEIIKFLVKGRERFAFLGALVLAASPLINMWMGHTVVAAVVYMQVCVCALILLFRKDNKLWHDILAVVLGIIGIVGFVMAWYPALQAPLGFLIIIFAVIIIFRYRKQNKVSRVQIAAIIVTAAVSLIIVGNFLIQSKEHITALLNTDFPGQRVITGGNYELQRVFYYPFQFLFKFSQGFGTGNACENSAVIPFLPVILFVVPAIVIHGIIKKRQGALPGKDYSVNKTLIALFAYMIFMISWLFVKYPEAFAKYTLFSFVTENRLIWVIGIVSVYIGMMCFVYICDKKPFNKWLSLCFSGASAMCLVCFTAMFYPVELNFLGGEGLAPVTVAVCLAFFCLFCFAFSFGLKKIVAVMLMLISVFFELTLHPYQIGTYAITDNALSGKITEIAEEDPDAYWLSEGDWVYGNFVYSHGVKTFNTTNQYMDEEKWRMIDEDGSERKTYNRYAQVIAEVGNTETTSVHLVFEDIIQVNFAPADLSRFGIDYLLTDDAELKSILPGAELIYKDELSGKMIYKLS